MGDQIIVEFNTDKYKYVIDWGDGTTTLAETFLSARITVNNEVHRTIVPRYQNDIVIKYRETDEVKAVLPWIGVINYDGHYWCPPSKICPPTYGEWIRYDTTDDGNVGYFS